MKVVSKMRGTVEAPGGVLLYPGDNDLDADACAKLKAVAVVKLWIEAGLLTFDEASKSTEKLDDPGEEPETKKGKK